MREKEENVEGMITAITVNLDTRSCCQGETQGGDTAKCYSKDSYSRELQLLAWMTGKSWMPCRSVVWKGRGVSFVKEVAGGSLRKWRQRLQHHCAGNLVSSIRRD